MSIVLRNDTRRNGGDIEPYVESDLETLGLPEPAPQEFDTAALLAAARLIVGRGDAEDDRYGSREPFSDGSHSNHGGMAPEQLVAELSASLQQSAAIPADLMQLAARAGEAIATRKPVDPSAALPTVGLPSNREDVTIRPAASPSHSEMAAPSSSPPALPPSLPASLHDPALDHMPVPVSRSSRIEEGRQHDPAWHSGGAGIMVAAAAILLLIVVVNWNSPIGHKIQKTTPAADSMQQVANAAVIPNWPRLQAGPALVARPGREAVTFAASLIASGELDEARDLLARAADEGIPEAKLALAETFDPNVLAAWGIRHAQPDVARARDLYAAAAAEGNERARQRLEALD